MAQRPLRTLRTLLLCHESPPARGSILGLGYGIGGSMTIKRKFSLFTSIIIAVFIVLSAFIYATIEEVKINGSLYKKIIYGNNLIADVLPPPNYIIESYLTAYEMLFNINDDSKVKLAREHIQNKLVPEFQDRYEFWKADTIYLSEGATLKGLFMESGEYAESFFEALNLEYLPSILLKDQASATKVFNEKLKPNYDKHRAVVDKIVSGAIQENMELETHTSDILKRNLMILVAIALFFIVFFAAYIIILSRSILTSLGGNVSILKDISEGEGDLTRRIEEKSRDEVGEMAKYFNLTFDKIRNSVAMVKKQSGILQAVGADLSSNMVETAAAINEISANIQSIKNQTMNQSASVSETSATMEQITKGIGKLNRLIEDQSANVTESSSAIEQMMANIASVTQTLVKNAENIKNLTESSDSGKASLDKISVAIKEVAKESEGLIEISRLIQSIASQTNLLSMNAAIEAAHAGESGKGFAVVADEIRKLAETSGEQTKTISRVLKRIKDSIVGITGFSEEVSAKFTLIEAEVKTVGEQETGIRKAMEEQSEGSKMVLEAITILNDITQTVRASSAEMLSGSQQVSKEAENMDAISQEISGGMNEMPGGAEQISVAVSKVNELSIENKASIDALFAEVEKFKV